MNSLINDPRVTHLISNSDEVWLYDGKKHRLDGPAISGMVWVGPDQYDFDWVNEWWYMGTKLDCFSQKEFEKLLKLKAFW